MPRHNTKTVVVQNVPSIGWLQWWNIADSLYKKEQAAEQYD